MRERRPIQIKGKTEELKMIKNRWAALALCTALLIIIAIGFGEAQEESVFRLHILANSNSEKDQAVKMAVRDAVLKFEEQRFDGVGNKEDARKRLMDNGDQLLAEIERVLRQNGMDYGAQLQVGEFAFPYREYGGVSYPADDYEALRIILGDGAGENWWCVMFPPLCILEIDDGEIDNKDIDGEAQELITFDSFFVELFEAIKGGTLWEFITGKQ